MPRLVTLYVTPLTARVAGTVALDFETAFAPLIFIVPSLFVCVVKAESSVFTLSCVTGTFHTVGLVVAAMEVTAVPRVNAAASVKARIFFIVFLIPFPSFLLYILYIAQYKYHAVNRPLNADTEVPCLFFTSLFVITVSLIIFLFSLVLYAIEYYSK